MGDRVGGPGRTYRSRSARGRAFRSGLRSAVRVTPRRAAGSLAVLAAAAVVAACAPPPGPPAPPSPPTITRFFASAERTEAPVLAAVGWTIGDPNGDALRCRVDTDGDGTFEHVIDPCRSIDSLLAEFTTPGSRTLTLEVDDGDFPPVRAQTTVDVSPGPSETYEITLRIDPNMRPEFAAAFQGAADRWAEAIVAGVPDVPFEMGPINLFGFPAFSGIVDDVLIDARDVPMDGPGKVLGRAGAFAVREPKWQPYYGIMEFDTADLESLLASGRLDDVILHEMGHVLGIGANWLLTGQLTGMPFDPHYTGRAGVAAYQEMGGDFLVPVENDGALGTVFGHWRESVFRNELMTGYLNSGHQPMSRLTIAALADNGYGVDLSAADPYTLPAPLAGARAHQGERPHTDPIEPQIFTPSG